MPGRSKLTAATTNAVAGVRAWMTVGLWVMGKLGQGPFSLYGAPGARFRARTRRWWTIATVASSLATASYDHAGGGAPDVGRGRNRGVDG